MRVFSVALCVLSMVCETATGGAAGPMVRAPVVRDTWFSNVGKEADCNTGGSSRLKVKSIQEMSLLDIDPRPLAGRVVVGATLHLRLAGRERLWRVTVSSFAAPWVEGTASTYEPQQGSSTFNRRRHPDEPWAYPGSDLTAVMLGQGGTVWSSADAASPDADGWQQVSVAAPVVAARIAGISYGFLVFDDTGSEWTRQGDRFRLRIFPNRFLYSREAGKDRAPYLTVELGAADRSPPLAVGGLHAIEKDLPAGQAEVSWLTPKDNGPSGVCGFFVTVAGKPIPRYLIPPAGRPGQAVTLRLRDLFLPPGKKLTVEVWAVDGAGNCGPRRRVQVAVSRRRLPPLPAQGPQPFEDADRLPTIARARVAVVDAVDKVGAVSGKLIPPRPSGYLAANHLWSARQRRVRLFAARNEFVAFQVVLLGRVTRLVPTLRFPDDPALVVAVGKCRPVKAKSGPLPDPVVPVTSPVSVPDPAAGIAQEHTGSLLFEIYVSHRARAGEHQGTLKLSTPGGSLSLPVTLHVWDFGLPDRLSFLPEMNCYGLPANERAYYRLAHRHRTVLNRLPYSQNGQVHAGCAPDRRGDRLDWTRWDARFGPYLDGSAFADLPRGKVPLECFYLPLHENWPTPMQGNYNGSYWADQAFPASYRRAFVAMAQAFARHFAAKGWRHTYFQCYLNNKNSFKQRGWSRGSSPWLLDEPVNWQDFWALRYYGQAFQDGVRGASGNAKLVFRCDISRPQWQRDALDGLINYYVVNGRAFRRYRRMVLDRKERFDLVVVDYGTTNAVEDSNIQPVGWCLDSWTLGSDGVLPWQTIGRPDSWKRADQLALFYPGEAIGRPTPVPSLRLKAYRRGEQDVEYLTLFCRMTGEPRWAVGRAVRAALHLAGEPGGTGFTGGEDAGLLSYANLDPQQVWQLRVRIGRFLSEHNPSP